MLSKQRLFRLIYYWIPPFIWMLFIFSLSAKSNIGTTQSYIYDFIIFKTLHIIEYAVLYFLFLRAFRTLSLSLRKQFIFPAVCSLMFAVSDEIHQLFTATRQGKVQDVFIDLIGIIIMYGIVKKNLKFFKRFI